MAELETGIYTLLAADSTVAGIVGTRIYPALAPQNVTYPCIVYQRVGADRAHHTTGASGMSEVIVQVTSMAATYLAVKALAAAVRTAMDAQRGMWGGVDILAAYIHNEMDTLDAEPSSDARRLYGIQQDYGIFHRE
ncbi:MAG TPA: DUF3168 domain-containing protein [Phycisphaerae bacterium]|nr:DUF3168 domain-containing protein [Phycisphaerae bacterium]